MVKAHRNVKSQLLLQVKIDQPRSGVYANEYFAHVRLRPCILDENGNTELVWTYTPHYGDLNGLRIHAQIGGMSTVKSYAWSLGYEDASAVTLNRAEAMAKVLRRTTNRFNKLRNALDPYSYPETFGEYVALMAQAMGAKVLDGQGGVHKDNAAVAAAIDAEVERLFKACHPELAKADAAVGS